MYKDTSKHGIIRQKWSRCTGCNNFHVQKPVGKRGEKQMQKGVVLKSDYSGHDASMGNDHQGFCHLSLCCSGGGWRGSHYLEAIAPSFCVVVFRIVIKFKMPRCTRQLLCCAGGYSFSLSSVFPASRFCGFSVLYLFAFLCCYDDVVLLFGSNRVSEKHFIIIDVLLLEDVRVSVKLKVPECTVLC